MTRTLRPRKTRKSYVLEESDSEKEENSPVEDANSGDDFQLAEDDGGNMSENQDNDMEVEADSQSEEVENLPLAPKSTRKSKTPKRYPNYIHISAHLRLIDLKRIHRQQAQPSADHRHHAPPLYLDPRRVERLVSHPSPFGPSMTTSTNSCLSEKVIYERYLRANTYNIGSGPLWDFMEDRSWWKESLRVPDDEVETEATRRPRVYESVEVGPDMRILSERYVMFVSRCFATLTVIVMDWLSFLVIIYLCPQLSATSVL